MTPEHRHFPQAPLQRERKKETNEVLWVVSGESLRHLPAIFVHQAYETTHAIRILDAEYDAIDSTSEFFTHFNLEHSGHKIGLRYILPRITKQGYFKYNHDEVAPVLSFRDVYIAECVSVRDFVAYKDLLPNDFQYSMNHIVDAQSLEDTILKRYRVSMPLLTDEEILERGVGVTTLRLLSKVTLA